MNIRDKILAYLYDRREATVNQIAQDIREEVDEVQAALRVLEREGLVIKRQKGLIFKKEVYELTASGLEEAKRAYEKVQRVANEIVNTLQYGEEVPQEYVDLIPLLITLSLIDTMLLQDIMLFDLFIQ